MKADRKNKNKVELHQCPPEVSWAISVILQRADKSHGGKYDKGNWKKGSDYTQLLDCMERHFDKMKSGLDNDEEDGLPHSWHLAANVMFYIFNEIHHPENDNRDKQYPMDPEVFTQFLKKIEKPKEESVSPSSKRMNAYSDCDKRSSHLPRSY